MDKHLDYSEIRWKNFKGYKDTGWLKIKPITIVLGANNSGKTNFLAPFLLMSQTVNSRDRLSPLILKGEIYDGGNFQEIVKDYDINNEIFFGFKYHIHSSDEKLSPVGDYPPGAFDVTFKVDSKHSEIKLKQTTLYDIYERKYLSLGLDRRSKYYKYTGIGSSKFTEQEVKSIKNSQPINFLFSPNSVLSELESNSKNSNEDEKVKRKVSRFSEGYSQFLSAISYNTSRVRDYLGDLSFIGPIRDNPHRVYEITNETYNTVGIKGENLPNILKKLGNKNQELNNWIQKFGFGDSIELVHHFSNTYSLRFLWENSGFYTTISNAGFGASQVLPLIVQALVSPRRSITIAEQPEIHLNPSIQCVLADLFVYMAKKGQTVIVESHSEHMLLRLRRLIAEDQISSEDVAIYFVERDGIDSRIREIKIQENGHILPIDWPKGFMNETLKESLALASVQSKRKRNG